MEPMRDAIQPAGFAADQIINLATDLRNSLSSIDAAHIIIDGTVEAIFAVVGDRLHVASRGKSNVIHILTLNNLREPPPPQPTRACHQGPAEAGVTALSAAFQVMIHV